MARQEQEREDLLREATALVERVELKSTKDNQVIVLGFRKNGAASVFFDADPVYQFNSQGQLRRAFVGGLLYKAVEGSLASLDRHRTPTETQLVRRDLSAGELTTFLETMKDRLANLVTLLNSGAFEVIGQVPDNGDVIAVFQRSLPVLMQAQVASSPHA